MLPHQGHRDRALQHYEGAFHLLHVTFPLAKDPKLLLGVVHNIFKSLEASVDAILEYERQLQLVPRYEDHFQSKFTTFRYRSMKRNKIAPEHAQLMELLHEILELHSRSPMVFQRGNRLVICSKDYQLQIISLQDLKKYLSQAKEFLEQMQRITGPKSS